MELNIIHEISTYPMLFYIYITVVSPNLTYSGIFSYKIGYCSFSSLHSFLHCEPFTHSFLLHIAVAFIKHPGLCWYTMGKKTVSKSKN